MTGKELDLLLDTCLLAGKIMMESNAEMYRVEDTMSRIALASGNFRLVSYVTQTGLFIGFRANIRRTLLRTASNRPRPFFLSCLVANR